jgi:hypothetical protein
LHVIFSQILEQQGYVKLKGKQNDPSLKQRGVGVGGIGVLVGMGVLDGGIGVAVGLQKSQALHLLSSHSSVP